MEHMKNDNQNEVKRPYFTPHLIIHGTVEEITQGWFGWYSDWFQGDANPPGMCNPGNPHWGDHCPTGS